MRKIYIETSCLKNRFTGIGKSVNQLITTLREINLDIVEISPEKLGVSNSFLYFNYYIPTYCKKYLTEEDVFLIPNNMSKFWRLPHINTWVIVHDIIPLSKFGYHGIRRYLYRYKMTKLRKTSRIICISEYVKKNICDMFSISFEQVSVLYWNCIEKDNISHNKSDFFLSIGTGEPRKNVKFLIENWKTISNGEDLLLFGKEWRTGAHEELKREIDRYHMDNVIHLLGAVDEEKLSHLYSEAKGFIFPSLEEGFGLPPLEALAHGCTIILPKTPINYELYGNCSLMYSLGNINEMKKCLARIDSISSEENREYSKKFSTVCFRNRIKELFIG